jgi:hypothetical protein
LVPLEGVIAAARDCADIAEVRTIAFPQEGLLPVPSWEEALRLQAPPEKVWFAGRLVTESAVRSELYRTG